MNVRKATSWTCWPAKSLLFTACGLAGCTSGPHISTASKAMPIAETGRTANLETAVLAQPATQSANSIWAGIDRRRGTPTDPFLTASNDVVRVSENRQVASKPVVATSHAECGLPAITPNSSLNSAPGIVRVHDGRLPPAAPLGASNPFQREAGSADQKKIVASPPSAESSPAVSPLPVRLVKSSRETNAGTSLPKINPVPVGDDLNDSGSNAGVTRNTVQNGDMIVESNLLRKRSEWREEVLPPRVTEEVPFPIAPRRPFSAPGWESETPATASANLPIEISPSSTIAQEEDPFSVASLGSDGAAPSELDDLAALELPKIENDVDSPLNDGAGDAGPTLTAENEIEAGPSFEAPAFGTQEEAPAPPSDPVLTLPPTTIATATSEKVPTPWSTSRKANRIVSPLELDEASRIASKEAHVDAKRSTGTPLAIGVALAAVAIGAVAIRRRFS